METCQGLLADFSYDIFWIWGFEWETEFFFKLNICILFSNGETKRSGVQNQTGLHDTPLKKKSKRKVCARLLFCWEPRWEESTPTAHRLLLSVASSVRVFIRCCLIPGTSICVCTCPLAWLFSTLKGCCISCCCFFSLQRRGPENVLSDLSTFAAIVSVL